MALGGVVPCVRRRKMKDESKTKEQLIDELVEMRRRIAELEALETEHRETEKALRESEEGCWDLLENANDLIQSVAPDSRFLYVNRTWREALGYSREEVAGLSLFDIIHPDSRAHCMEVFQRVLSGEEADRVEAVFVAKDGREILVEGNANCKLVDGKPVYTRGIFRDVTQRKRAEETLRAAQQYSQNLIDSSLDMIISVDQYRRIVEFNQAAQDTFGYSRAEVLGNHVDMLYADPSEGSRVHEMVQRTGRFTGEVVNKRENGQTFPSFLAASAMEDENGEFLGLMGVSRDITERKRMEQQLREYSENLERMVEDRTRQLKAAQEKLIRAEKLAAIGELAGGLGHELRSPLGAIRFSADFLKTKLGDTADEKVRRHLDLLEKQVDACDKTVADVLDFSRPGKLNIEEIHINQVIQEVIQANTPPRNVEVSTSLADSLSPATADAGQMGRVLSNLVTNAIQAMPRGGRLSLSTIGRGRFVEVRITDTGMGIPDGKLDKIFEPLFTTKAKGIGLGLAIVKTLVDRQNGTIEVESQVGKGTTFTVKLPIAGREVRSHE